ncbi:aldo/keto reductase [Anaerosporomusa subterranea]|uniref:Aldo/keto reductase n=1 Tax=Anaerosporomusa subterranea TaxID=1794912 RepID=A0A154BNN4_ANASB|nr:aldo/keto reductase [Anaerosporomusa subterranea]KYZ75460.1 aldo/keto reductase [Anaerosporomusa subterranea]
MKYKLLGKTGVLVSELCFGTMTFGSEADETESTQMFSQCRNAGVNFFDCSNNYSEGRAETILGKLIAGCRDEVVITTKVSQRVGKDINAIGPTRRHIMLSVEQSLTRLRTDRIDLYIIHYFDPFTAMDETLRALDDLVHQGKVLYLGVSNWAAWQIAKALGISERKCLARFECIQPMYNLVKRQAEVEILPLAESEQLGVIAYNPLAGGVLSGKYSPGITPQSGRLAEKDQYRKRYAEPIYYEVADRFVNYANALGVDPVTLAISWVKSNPAITAPILGARNTSQLSASLAAADFVMTSEMRESISQLSIKPGTATDRLEEELDSKYILRNRS